MESFAIVVPTIGRPSLRRLLDSLAVCQGPAAHQIVLVDDRPAADDLLDGTAAPGWLAGRVTVVRSGGRGPAAARNTGWRAVHRVAWVAFLDDDVLVTPSWLDDLASDLAVGDDVAGVQGLVTVPLPGDRRPNDWERGTAGLANSRWITADMAYRLPALCAVNGFDERFPRAFREDADVALRMQNAGFTLTTGTRRVLHPVRPAAWNASLKQQRGNADDVLMSRLHGHDWWTRAQAPKGRRSRHLGITGAALALFGSLVAHRPRAAVLAGFAWTAGTAEFAITRIAAGPRHRGEVARMLVTSVAIPPAAIWHWVRGLIIHRHVQRAAAQPVVIKHKGCRTPPLVLDHDGPGAAVAAVLVDRDGTIVHDVPYNSDPAKVAAIAGAREALERLRAAGLPVGVISNQSGVARGLIEQEQLSAVNARVEELLGPFDDWQVCVHGESAGCGCRKPEPGMVLAAAQALGVAVEQCIVIGDIGSDVTAAQRAGAQAILVPTVHTRAQEIAAAPVVHGSLLEAVDDVLARMAWR